MTARAGYRMAQHGIGNIASADTRAVLKPTAGNVQYMTLGFNGRNVLRIWPNVNFDANGQRAGITPYRWSAGPNDFGDWIRKYPAARGFGGRVTFLLGDPTDEATRLTIRQRPPWVLYEACLRAKRMQQERQGWAGLLDGGQNRGALLPEPTDIYLVQCAVFCRNGKWYGTDGRFPGFNDDRSVVMELSRSAGDAMLTELNKISSRGGDLSGSDWENLFEAGDPIAFEHGRFVNFYNLATGDPRVAAAQVAASHVSSLGDIAARQQQLAASGRAQIGYGCYLERTAALQSQHLVSASIPQEQQAGIISRIQPWDDILHFPSDIEQAHMIAPHFPADLIMFAFADHPEWIPAGTRERAVNATMHQVPAGLPSAFVARGVDPLAVGMQQGMPAPFAGQPQIPGLMPALPQGLSAAAAPSAPPSLGALQANAGSGFPGVPPVFGDVPPVAATAWGVPASEPSSGQFTPPPQQFAPPPPAPQQQFAPPPAAPQQFAPPPVAQQFAPPPQQFAPPPVAQQFAPPPAAQPPVAQPPQQQFAPPPVAQQFAPPPVAQQFAPPVAQPPVAQPPVAQQFAPPPVAQQFVPPPVAQQFAPPVAQPPVAQPPVAQPPVAQPPQQQPPQQQPPQQASAAAAAMSMFGS